MASVDPAIEKNYGRFPSSAVMSYRSVSPEEVAEQKENKTWWKSVKDTVVSGALVAVGLRPTEDERRHWELMKAIASEEGDEGTDETDGVAPPKSPASVEADSPPTTQPLAYTPSLLMRQVTKHSLGQEQQIKSLKSIKQNKATGRNQAVNTNLRPDLWRVVFDSVRAMSRKSDFDEKPSGKVSFKLGEIESESEEEEAEVAGGGELQADGLDETDGGAARRRIFSERKVQREDELFFDLEIGEREKKEREKREREKKERDKREQERRQREEEEVEREHGRRGYMRQEDEEGGYDEPDSAPAPRTAPPFQKQLSSTNFLLKTEKNKEINKETVESVKIKDERGARLQLKEIWGKATLSGGYLDGYGGLGGITKLLDFKYKDIPERRQRLLDARFLHKRPYFTYWLMMVHVIIMIVALSVYGFAPYGFDLREEREFVRQTDLSLAPTSKMVVPSAWGGPPQQALVLLGAIFAPCMRSDRQIINGIEEDRQMENSSSGCCVHRDRSGCFQASPSSCLPRYSDFIREGNDSTRAVCGTSPNTCLEPSRGFSAGIWEPQDILTWPICVRDSNDNSTETHLTCELTSRPCCYGNQAICIITTPDQCTFLRGRFHSNAFLCSQVDCLNDICGLLPFANFNEPDQFYRLWLALFLHAGLIHLFLSLLFSFFVLRHVEKRLGWLRTMVIYVLSGIGGNLVSAYLTPYNPEVGPAGSILGIVAYFFIFLIFESRLLRRPFIEFVKLFGVTVAFLLMGFIPFIDNMAHVGGFLFGLLISGVIVPFNPYKQYWSITKQDPKKNELFLHVKVGLIFGGLAGLVLLFVLFFVLLYVVQDTWIGFSFLTCIPFTSTLCLDQQQFIRNRTQFII